ncbi:MAG: hypothetical protein ACRERD_31460 [Candidatus Binatia bacterium]
MRVIKAASKTLVSKTTTNLMVGSTQEKRSVSFSEPVVVSPAPL